jgi:hypothetical protein
MQTGSGTREAKGVRLKAFSIMGYGLLAEVLIHKLLIINGKQFNNP